MPVQNCNVHVVFDGQWAIAAEGEGRLHVGLELTNAIALATSLAVERQVTLYIHDKNGDITQRIDCCDPAPRPEASAQVDPAPPVEAPKEKASEKAGNTSA